MFLDQQNSLKLSNTDIEVKYRDTSGVNSGVKQVTADSIKLDLTNGFNEQILTGSVRFKQVMILLLIAPAPCIEILIQATVVAQHQDQFNMVQVLLS
jgi:hypothetical protein